jgi:predicted nucleic acid-binding protein
MTVTATASAAHLSLGTSDPDDAWIVAEAMAGEADALVTGDAARRRARTIAICGYRTR